MAKNKKNTDPFENLDDGQKTFITGKVKELGYQRAMRFYSGKDTVSEFAQIVARDMFPKEAAKEPETPKPTPKKTEKSKTVKSKKKIDIDDVMDDGYED
jgi:hypothetical protein